MAYGGMRTYLGDQHEANEISEIQSPSQHFKAYDTQGSECHGQQLSWM